MRRFGYVIMNRLLLGLIPGEAEQDHVLIDPCLQMHRTLPDFVQVFQRLDRVFDLDVGAVVLVRQV